MTGGATALQCMAVLLQNVHNSGGKMRPETCQSEECPLLGLES
jgi:hypothetical protein